MKIKVLFVCLGNICRSPLAEAIFKTKIKQRNLQQFIEADSCGTSDYHIGDQPDARTIANARKNGITLDHCGRQLQEQDLVDFDYILAMDKRNLDNILQVPGAAQHRSKIALMRDHDPAARGAEVPDPYFGGEQGFEDVYQMLDRTMDHFIDHLKSTHLANGVGVTR